MHDTVKFHFQINKYIKKQICFKKLKFVKTHTILIHMAKCYMHQNYGETAGFQPQSSCSMGPNGGRGT